MQFNIYLIKSIRCVEREHALLHCVIKKNPWIQQFTKSNMEVKMANKITENTY